MLIAVSLIVSPVNAADLWKEGTDADVVVGTASPSDIDTLLESNAFNPLDRLLDKYIYGCGLSYTSATTVTIAIGQVVCENSSGVHRFRENTSTTTVDISTSDVGGLDTGSEAASTWYYIYAVADADATTFTAIISASSSAPTNASALYYRIIGRFYNDSSSNIRNWTVENWGGELIYWGHTTSDKDGSALAVGTNYQAATDGIVCAYASDGGNATSFLKGITDVNSSPSTIRVWDNPFGGVEYSITFPVKKEDYWQVASNNNDTVTITWTPIIHIRRP